MAFGISFQIFAPTCEKLILRVPTVVLVSGEHLFYELRILKFESSAQTFPQDLLDTFLRILSTIMGLSCVIIFSTFNRSDSI